MAEKNVNEELARLLSMNPADIDADNPDAVFAEFDNLREAERLSTAAEQSRAAREAADSVPVMGTVSDAARAAARSQQGRDEHAAIGDASDGHDEDVELAPPPTGRIPAPAPPTAPPQGVAPSGAGSSTPVAGHDSGGRGGAYLPEASAPAAEVPSRPAAHPMDVEAFTRQIFGGAHPAAPPAPSPTPVPPVVDPVADQPAPAQPKPEPRQEPAAAEPDVRVAAPVSVNQAVSPRPPASGAVAVSSDDETTPAGSGAPSPSTAAGSVAVDSGAAEAVGAEPQKTAVGTADQESADEPAAKKPATADRLGGVTERLGSWWTTFKGWPLIYKAIAVMVVLILFFVLAASCSGGDDAEEPQGGPAVVEGPATEAPVEPANPSKDGALVPETITSDCPAGSTRPELAFTSDKKDAWVCTRANGIDGAEMTVTFKRPVVLTSIVVVPGYNYVESSGVNQWSRHRVVTRILWRFGAEGDEQVVQEINPAPTGATLPLNSIATQKVQLVIQATEDASPDGASQGLPGVNKIGEDSFAMSSIKFMGHEA